jgi:L-sorbose 1-phosphate reductase
MTAIPKTARAVQLVGPDRLVLNAEKPVHEPGPHQVLFRVLCVGLCFSDLKLLKQFSNHVRKQEIVSGIDPAILAALPSYRPGEAPVVPGHEPVIEIVACGEGAERFRPGERYFVQADWRWLKTPNSNGAFGYNFEGALQEYTLVDERLLISPEGESMLLPLADPSKSWAAYGLVEPWACVEQSYRALQRRTLKPGGRMLVAADGEISAVELRELFERFGRPGSLTWLSNRPAPAVDGFGMTCAESIDSIADRAFDDVLYAGHNPHLLERLFDKADANALINLVRAESGFGRPVSTPLGRIHYEGLRLTGSRDGTASDGMARIPAEGELREGDRVHIVGAGGPMGVMHVMRDLCHGVRGISVYAGDLSNERLAALERIACRAAIDRGVKFQTYNPKESNDAPSGPYDYTAVNVPVPALVAQAVDASAEGARINIFAGIQAGVHGEIDLDVYLARSLYFIGTSGSEMSDMKVVLSKVESGRLDTNVSVAAVSGLDGAIDGIRAVERQEVPGKILVYPACAGLPLTPLDRLEESHPAVAERLANGVWTLDAERALLAEYGVER